MSTGLELLSVSRLGIPFVTPTFRHRTLIAAVTAVRVVDARANRLDQVDGLSTHHPTVWMEPHLALRLCPSGPPIDLEEVTTSQRASIELTIRGVLRSLPEWTPYFLLPVRYLVLPRGSGAISASVSYWPQHVMLATSAFASRAQLTEQILHEMAHQWLYLLEELWQLEKPSTATFRLPSGTTGRSAREVLGAAHVAAVLVHAYSRLPGNADRAAELASYGQRCTAMLDGASLTSEGLLVRELVWEALRV